MRIRDLIANFPSNLVNYSDSAGTHDVWQALGQVSYARQTSEIANKAFRRSIYFVRDLPAGSIIGPNDIRRIRPGMGLAPKHFNKLLGKRLKVAVHRGTATRWDLLDE